MMLKLKSFYDDQCRSRNLFIGPVDVEKTEKLLEIEISEAKKDERERTMEERKQRETEASRLIKKENCLMLFSIIIILFRKGVYIIYNR